MIEIQNHGPLILATNYWSSEIEAAGKLLVSPDAGAIRVSLPRSQWAVAGRVTEIPCLEPGADQHKKRKGGWTW